MPILVQENVLLAPYTIYKIGGSARFFVEARNSKELEEALLLAARESLPFFILGAGSNILVSDNGFNGVVIRIMGGEVEVQDGRVTADAGVMVARAVMASAEAGLTGFEWGIGIPGTIGGSVRGNAGCFGGEMAQVVERVRLLEFPISNFSRFARQIEDPRFRRAESGQFPNKFQIANSKFQIRELTNQECEFSYRDSIFKRHPEWVILRAVLKLSGGDQEKIRSEILRISRERMEKQAIGSKSCGCIFKNASWEQAGEEKEKLLERFPELVEIRNRPNIPASFLIDKAGLRSTKIGNISISPKHANFFVNEGGGTAEEVRLLVEKAKKTVEQKFGIELEEEIQYVGF